MRAEAGVDLVETIRRLARDLVAIDMALPDRDALEGVRALSAGSPYHALVEPVKGNEIIRSRPPSDDRKLLVAILSLEPSAVDSGKLDAVVNDIRRTADKDLQGTGLTAELKACRSCSSKSAARSSATAAYTTRLVSRSDA
jgi:hypothetical protein